MNLVELDKLIEARAEARWPGITRRLIKLAIALSILAGMLVIVLITLRARGIT